MSSESKLSKQKCVPCEGNASFLLTPDEVAKNLTYIEEWQLAPSGNRKMIFKKFSFKDFVEAMKFVNEVATIAEQEGHHPDIAISYNKVTLELTTHAIGGLSLNDFIIASKIDEI